MEISGIPHIVIIASDYARSKHFHVDALGLEIIAEASTPAGVSASSPTQMACRWSFTKARCSSGHIPRRLRRERTT